MKYEIYLIGEETEHLMTLYCRDSALKFIYYKHKKTGQGYMLQHFGNEENG